jgi:hypothetical protein
MNPYALAPTGFGMSLSTFPRRYKVLGYTIFSILVAICISCLDGQSLRAMMKVTIDRVHANPDYARYGWKGYYRTA